VSPLHGGTHSSNADATEDMREVLEAVRDRMQVLPGMRRQDWQGGEAPQDCQKNVHMPVNPQNPAAERNMHIPTPSPAPQACRRAAAARKVRSRWRDHHHAVT